MEEELRRFIVDNLLFGQTDIAFTDEDSFIELGIVDSAGVLELVAFLEATYHVKVDGEDMTPANLDSIASIVRFVQTKRHAS